MYNIQALTITFVIVKCKLHESIFKTLQTSDDFVHNTKSKMK